MTTTTIKRPHTAHSLSDQAVRDLADMILKAIADMSGASPRSAEYLARLRTKNACEARLAAEFGRRRGWKVSKANLRIYTTMTDHPVVFWDPATRTHVVVAHVYGYNAAAARAFAKEHGLTVERVPPETFPAWHYPGACDLLVWRGRNILKGLAA